MIITFSWANTLNESFPKFALYAGRHWPLWSAAKVITPLTEMACMYLWITSTSPYWEGIERGYQIAFTDSWYPHLEQSLWFWGWEQAMTIMWHQCWMRRPDPESHTIRFPWVSHCISPYRFLINRDTGLGQLESFLVYFQRMMAAAMGWTPNLLY